MPTCHSVPPCKTDVDQAQPSHLPPRCSQSDTRSLIWPSILSLFFDVGYALCIAEKPPPERPRMLTTPENTSNKLHRTDTQNWALCAPPSPGSCPMAALPANVAAMRVVARDRLETWANQPNNIER